MADTQPSTSSKKKEELFEINITLADDGEPKRIFVGADGRDFLIERGKNVVVPKVVLGVLDNAEKGVSEQDPNDPNKLVTVMRKRFSYSIIRAL